MQRKLSDFALWASLAMDAELATHIFFQGRGNFFQLFFLSEVAPRRLPRCP